jgi:hypothetical protein
VGNIRRLSRRQEWRRRRCSRFHDLRVKWREALTGSQGVMVGAGCCGEWVEGRSVARQTRGRCLFTLRMLCAALKLSKV